MKQLEDTKTLELALPKRRGRPFTGKAMSNAERQKLWRQRRSFARALVSVAGVWSALNSVVADLDAEA